MALTYIYHTNITNAMADLSQLKKAIVGLKIIDVRYLTPKEVADMGWTDDPDADMALTIQLDHGDYLIIQADPEGNGPGRVLFLPSDTAEEVSIY